MSDLIRAYDEGKAAYGQGLTQNPYSSTLLRESWRQGWLDGCQSNARIRAFVDATGPARVQREALGDPDE